MSILGVIVRAHPDDIDGVAQRLRAMPGVEVADAAGACDGRLVVVMEDCEASSAAANLGAVALWPRVLNTSLVYEYSGPDAPAPDSDVESFGDWRRSLGERPSRS